VTLSRSDKAFAWRWGSALGCALIACGTMLGLEACFGVKAKPAVVSGGPGAEMTWRDAPPRRIYDAGGER